MSFRHLIVETSANRFYRVAETGLVDLGHVWRGVEVKLVKNQWVPKAKAREELVRKAATRVVEIEEATS